MYEKYHDRGFELIAFPANQFGCQAPYESAVERDYAYEKFGMRFPIYDKIGVKRRGNPQCDGPQDEHPLYRFLKQERAFSDELEWNYVKFLVDKEGQVKRRYKPGDPLDQGLERDLLALLDDKPLPAKKRVYLGAA